MKRSGFSEEQVAYVLRLADSVTPMIDVCRQIGVTELKRLKKLETENARLKRIVADLTLDQQMLQEVVQKSFVGCPAA